MTELSLFLPKVCEALLTADTDIVAIVQFGSSVYAPESAIDMDLLVITKKRKAIFIGIAWVIIQSIVV